MALEMKDLVALGKALARAEHSAPVAYSFNGQNFSYAQLDETFRQELNAVVDYNTNNRLAYSVLEQVIDDVLPKRIEQNYGAFADIRTVKDGEKVSFRRKVAGSRQRAKQFVTRVGLAGVYEVFKLGGSESFEIRTSAIGGAAQIAFEDFLTGRVDFSELLAILMEGMDDLIYSEVAEAMTTSINQLPANNQGVANKFDEALMDHLCMIAGAYGTVTIYCTEEFAATMVPADQWKYTEDMKNELWKNGRLAGYKGKRVIILPQTIADGSNTRKVVDASMAWIIPTGAEKPVKVVFEGDTHLREENPNHDWSKDVHMYKKVGVAAMFTNNICVYKNTSLEGLDIIKPEVAED